VASENTGNKDVRRGRYVDIRPHPLLYINAAIGTTAMCQATGKRCECSEYSHFLDVSL
jgi:hypothetical protein